DPGHVGETMSPGTSSGEVKENRDTRNLDSGAVGPRCFQSFRSAGGTFGRERMQPLEGGAGSGRLLQLQLVCRKHSWSVSPKNALVHLNELRPGLKYRTLSQRGPRHAPVFSVTVEVDGVAFQGTGATKKKAKMRAAELALGSFVQFPNAPQALFTMGALGPTSVDFTSDRATDLLGALFKGFEPGHGDGKLDHLPPDLAVCSHWGQGAEPGLREHRSPVALLNELRPGLRYLCLPRGAEGGRVRRSFVMALTVDGRTFEGSGRSKKLAKNQAALSALRDLFAGALPPDVLKRKSNHEGPTDCVLQGFAESVSRLVAEKYSELAVRWSPLHACPRVLAGIVMTRGMDIRHAEVIAIATGTKCLNGEYMSDQGLVVNDCHAEVVVRRAFVRFLYSQLELFLRQQEDWQRSIFIPHEDKGYRLHSDVRFHMYVSSSPCGDARLNSPYETTADFLSLLPAHRLLHLARRSHSHLRTKIECGEGTVPVRCCHAAQTWDGVLQGEPLATMSCTDKMARWNVLGLQGALLTHLVEPVYLYSLTVGSLQHVGHLSRAVAHRLGGVLPPTLVLVIPGWAPNRCLCRGRPYHPGKSPGTSVNWTAGDAQPEVLNATTGTRMASGSPSRLCKRALFTRWAKLVHRSTPLPYCQAKRAAEVYQAVKQRWVSALREAGLGTWVRKPPEQDHFLLCV
uniref:Adenosine deaminase RNA specific B2 (inactive) n=1 Tax=Scleropages formosus TaxID=113540 RepID=A0A8C9R1F9_SCLFO